MRWPDGRLSDAQSALVAKHWPYALRTVGKRFRNLYGDNFDWDGAIAIGMMRAAKAWQPDREDGKRLNFKTFMYRSAVSECRNMLRQSRPLGYRRRSFGDPPGITSLEVLNYSDDDDHVHYEDAIPDTVSPAVGNDLERWDAIQPLLLLGSLTTLEHDVIMLRYFRAEGGLFREVAKAKGMCLQYMIAVHGKAIGKLRDATVGK